MGERNNNQIIRGKATAILEKLYGDGAHFRAGQYEAIEAAMTHKRTLVAQRTGWGKSLVYFVCTKLLRARGEDATVVVVPSALLRENQMAAARKLGLRCGDIRDTAERERADMLFVTPDALVDDDVQSWLRSSPIGLLVIDEAHCMSPHSCDYLPAYGRLRELMAQLPNAVPVLAATATAGDAVAGELKRQMGEDVFVSKGPLGRESLYLQVLSLPDKCRRYAWLLQNLPKLDGSGIIYCPTDCDCRALAAFLRENGIAAEAYASWEDEHSRAAEECFRRNELKALVAASEPGMGYDKGDIAFVIHTRMPSSIVSYYREIGRAGRSLPKAYVFLMHSGEDEETMNAINEAAFSEMEEEIAAVRRREWEQMKRMAYLQGCYNQYIASCLDDPTASDCGHCTNCMGFDLFPAAVSPRCVSTAEAYLKEKGP